jgi:hypothetical protein
MARYLRRIIVAHTEDLFLIRIKAIALFMPVTQDVRGVYLKCKRGSTRVSGTKRYVLCPENHNIDLDDCFEKESIFYRKGNSDKYESK